MDEAAFLAAILADPSDDAPRLVYADWLGEHGQEGRGEFIRVQCELARLPPDPVLVTGTSLSGKGRWIEAAADVVRALEDGSYERRKVLHARERELWHDPLILRELPDASMVKLFPVIGDELPTRGGILLHVRRGFGESVTCSAADWLAHADTIAAAQPVRSVTLTTWPDRSRRLSISTSGPDVVTVLVPLAGRLVESSAETEGEAVSEAMRQRWPGIAFHLPATDRWGSFDVPVYDPAADDADVLIGDGSHSPLGTLTVEEPSPAAHAPRDTGPRRARSIEFMGRHRRPRR